MNYRVDVSLEYQKAKSKLFRLSLLFSIILTVIIVVDTLLVVLAKEDYLVQLIVAITITILFAWFSLFYFFNIYNEANAHYRYFKGYESGIHQTDEVIYISQNDELTYVNGLYVYPVNVKYVSTLHDQEKIIYVTKKDLGYDNGDKLTIETYQRILLKAEKHQ